MEITPDTISQKLDAAGVLYRRQLIDHGQQLRVLDGNGKIPDDTIVSLYTSGNIVIIPKSVGNLRMLLNKLS